MFCVWFLLGSEVMSEIKKLTQKELEAKGKELFDKLHKKNELGISPIMIHNLGFKSGEWNRCEDEEEKVVSDVGSFLR